MKYRLLPIIALLILSILVPAARAQELDQASRCVLAQNNLKNIQRPRDLEGRVDRLQAYQYIYDKIDTFVVRLERNQQPQSADLRASLVRLKGTIEDFKNDYEKYDAARDSVTKLSNCAQNTDEFNVRLQSARQARIKVNEDIQLIESILGSSVKNQVDSLYRQLRITTKNEVNRE